jgi:hypothetical protein
MPKYRIIATAFKPSGKMYSTGNPIDLGESAGFPSDKTHAIKAEMYLALDQACNLPLGAVETNNLNVLIEVLDDTEDPVVYQEFVMFK